MLGSPFKVLLFEVLCVRRSVAKIGKDDGRIGNSNGGGGGGYEIHLHQNLERDNRTRSNVVVCVCVYMLLKRKLVFTHLLTVNASSFKVCYASIADSGRGGVVEMKHRRYTHKQRLSRAWFDAVHRRTLIGAGLLSGRSAPRDMFRKSRDAAVGSPRSRCQERTHGPRCLWAMVSVVVVTWRPKALRQPARDVAWAWFLGQAEGFQIWG